ncbi:MAG: hypothetical protein AAGJ78_04710 [Pseudomonadota bacterium]
MSAVAAIAASIAAFYSLRVSKQSIELAESTALASHHHSATLQYYEAVKALNRFTEDLNEVCYHLYNDWSYQIETFDNRPNGGTNPRPLRHVLGNAKDILVSYSSRYHRLSDGVFSIVVGGLGTTSEEEYQKLLKKADGKYSDFEDIFGKPSKRLPLASSNAFRWSYYQLIRRVKPEDWESIWESAWLEDGWLTKYKKEYIKAQSIFEEAREALESEVAKLKHTPLPLEKNSTLHSKYNELLTILKHLEDSSPDRLEQYRDYQFVDEFCLLLLCAMSTARIVKEQLSTVHLLATH